MSFFLITLFFASCAAQVTVPSNQLSNYRAFATAIGCSSAACAFNANSCPRFATCDVEGNIVTLDFGELGLTGTLPNPCVPFRNLTVLSLQRNQLRGPVLPGLQCLTRLTFLRIGTNKFDGPIANLGRLTTLVSLFAGANDFTGKLDDFPVLDMPALRNLSLQGNTLLTAGIIPAIGSLRGIIIDNVNLSGATIPPRVSNLEEFSARACGLTGTVPDLRALTRLQIAQNRLTGPVGSANINAGIGICDLFELLQPAEQNCFTCGPNLPAACSCGCVTPAPTPAPTPPPTPPRTLPQTPAPTPLTQTPMPITSARLTTTARVANSLSPSMLPSTSSPTSSASLSPPTSSPTSSPTSPSTPLLLTSPPTTTLSTLTTTATIAFASATTSTATIALDVADDNLGAIVGGAVGGAVAVALLVGAVCWLRSRRRPIDHAPSRSPSSEYGRGDLRTLAAADEYGSGNLRTLAVAQGEYNVGNIDAPR